MSRCRIFITFCGYFANMIKLRKKVETVVLFAFVTCDFGIDMLFLVKSFVSKVCKL